MYQFKSKLQVLLTSAFALSLIFCLYILNQEQMFFEKGEHHGITPRNALPRVSDNFSGNYSNISSPKSILAAGTGGWGLEA